MLISFPTIHIYSLTLIKVIADIRKMGKNFTAFYAWLIFHFTPVGLRKKKKQIFAEDFYELCIICWNLKVLFCTFYGTFFLVVCESGRCDERNASGTHIMPSSLTFTASLPVELFMKHDWYQNSPRNIWNSHVNNDRLPIRYIQSIFFSFSSKKREWHSKQWTRNTIKVSGLWVYSFVNSHKRTRFHVTRICLQTKWKNEITMKTNVGLNSRALLSIYATIVISGNLISNNFLMQRNGVPL